MGLLFPDITGCFTLGGIYISAGNHAVDQFFYHPDGAGHIDYPPGIFIH